MISSYIHIKYNLVCNIPIAFFFEKYGNFKGICFVSGTCTRFFTLWLFSLQKKYIIFFGLVLLVIVPNISHMSDCFSDFPIDPIVFYDTLTPCTHKADKMSPINKWNAFQNRLHWWIVVKPRCHRRRHCNIGIPAELMLLMLAAGQFWNVLDTRK